MGLQKVEEAKNNMGFFDKQGRVKAGRVFSFIKSSWDISKEELAQAFGFTSDQLREDRMGQTTRETISRLAASIEEVSGIFKGDKNKTTAWFNRPNVHFGGFSPKELVLNGRFRKVQNFIFNSRYM